MLATTTNKRTLGLLGVVLLFVALLGFFLLQVNPLTGEIQDQNGEISRLQSQNELLTKKLKEKAGAQEGKDMDEIQRALPLWDNTEQFLMDLDTTGKSASVKTLSVTFSSSESNQLQSMLGGEQSPYPTVRELKTSIVLEGTYEHLLDWFERIYALDRLSTVESFTLVQPTTPEQRLKPVTLSVNMTAYFDPSYRELVSEVLEPF